MSKETKVKSTEAQCAIQNVVCSYCSKELKTDIIELDGELMHYDIIEMGKIDNFTIEVVFEDETKKEFPVIKLASRDEAIEKCKEVTKLALNADNAFEILHTLCNDFEKHRNYEIEMYLDRLTNKYYRIDELCPFNGFKWFD
jgi:hypothetical protein